MHRRPLLAHASAFLPVTMSLAALATWSPFSPSVDSGSRRGGADPGAQVAAGIAAAAPVFLLGW